MAENRETNEINVLLASTEEYLDIQDQNIIDEEYINSTNVESTDTDISLSSCIAKKYTEDELNE